MTFISSRRFSIWLIAPLLSLMLMSVSCGREPEPIDPPAVTTPYSLVLPAKFPQNAQVPADNPLTEEGVALGRMLFYETRLSSNNTMSCGSCHQQSKAFTDGRALALGVDGVPHRRGAMSLANLLWEPQLNWDGAALSLEAQARIPIENPVELHQSLAAGVVKLQATDTYPPLFKKAFNSRTITEDNVLKALAQFERTLISATSRFDRYSNGERNALSQTEVKGLMLFTTHPTPDDDPIAAIRGANCFHCHNAPLFTVRNEFFNNGLDLNFTDLGRGAVTGRATDNGKFRAPSLRNIALTAPYMHDGRFATLEQVLDHYSDHVALASPNLDPNMLDGTNTVFGTQMDLTATEKRQLIAFLHTLTDSTFITDSRFSNPF